MREPIATSGMASPVRIHAAYVACNSLCSAAPRGTPHQQIDKHIRCRQETIQYALRPPNQIVFELLMPPLNGAKARGLQESRQGSLAKVKEVSRHIKVKPSPSEELSLNPIDVWDGDEQDTRGGETAANAPESAKGIAQMFKAMPERDAIEYGASSENFARYP